MPSPRQKLNFPTTSMGAMVEAGQPVERVDSRVLNDLLKRYLPALQAHLVHAWRLPEHEAQDYVQGFITDKLLKDQLIKRFDPNRGRFRRYLCTALEHYVISAMRKEKSKRRHPGEEAMVSLEEFLRQERPVLEPSATAVFDLIWTQRTLEETLRRVESECRRTGRAAYWGIFESRVIRPHWRGEKAESYAVLVAKHGFASPMQASNAFLTVKRMFARTFRQVVQEYVKAESLADSEINEVKKMLGRLSGAKTMNQKKRADK